MELVDGSLVTGPPKSAAGKRLVSIPAIIMPDVTTHLSRYTLPGEESLVFTGSKNAPLRRSNFTRTWRLVTESTGLTSFHFHDLRHTGNNFAAATGASLRELMDRMGHSSTRAALIYQHGTAERDRVIQLVIAAVTLAAAIAAWRAANAARDTTREADIAQVGRPRFGQSQGIQPTLERGFEADRLTDARRACPTGAGSNLYPVCGGVQVTSRRRPSSAASRATRSRLRSAHRPETRSSRRLRTARCSGSGPTLAHTDTPRRT